jgi:hypothetical protein
MGQKQNHKQNERSKNSKYDKFCIKKKMKLIKIIGQLQSLIEQLIIF